MTNPIVNPSFFLQILYIFSNIYVRISETTNNVYNASSNWMKTNYPDIHTHASTIYNSSNIIKLHITHIIYTRIFGFHFEPLTVSWTNISHISTDNKLIETYQPDTTTQCDSSLQITKSDDKYRFCLCESLDSPELVYTPSKVRFISVEYTHPELSGPLYFEMPASYFMVGNHLLSNIFVLRYLNYYIFKFGTNIPFDDRYTINVMDNNINQFVLHWSDYCVLEETKYTIITQPPEMKKQK